MPQYTTRVIDGTTAQAGDEWPDMSRIIEAKSASAAMDAIEAEIDDRPPTAKTYGVGVDDVITITISAFSEDGLDRASRTLHYPAA